MTPETPVLGTDLDLSLLLLIRHANKQKKD